jgi:hypothetical protein
MGLDDFGDEPVDFRDRPKDYEEKPVFDKKLYDVECRTVAQMHLNEGKPSFYFEHIWG